MRQVIEGRYVDRKKLTRLMKKIFPDGDYIIRMQLNCWILTLPRLLTEDEIDDCCCT
ncbi:hypothetical protein DL98DRAFT_519023 [Cadophora sp. DSE1049]|nr:hypothetical protein DL98DRAFT_519023 [Cadophora sp. DSE1049]